MQCSECRECSECSAGLCSSEMADDFVRKRRAIKKACSQTATHPQSSGRIQIAIAEGELVVVSEWLAAHAAKPGQARPLVRVLETRGLQIHHVD